MKLLKRLRPKIVNGKNGQYKQSYGLFVCHYCEKLVEKRLSPGKLADSCGCNRDKAAGKKLSIHGDSQKGAQFYNLYRVWAAMKRRCSKKTDKAYNHYGGRGITVCQDWLEYLPFKRWAILNGYDEATELDRIDNNAGYSPENCRFVSHQENSRNRRSVVLTRQKSEEIRNMWKSGSFKIKKLAKIYSVSEHVIKSVTSGRNWV